MWTNGKMAALCIIVFLCLGFSPANAMSIELKVSDASIEVGEIFEVEVWVDNEGSGEGLLAYGFDTFFDFTVFNYTGYSVGQEFFDFSDSNNPNNVSGAGLSYSDEVLLATLFFDAVNTGNGVVGVNGIYDGFFNGLFYEFSGANIQIEKLITVISTPATVPEPTTLLLLGTGLIGLCAIGRAR